MARKQAKAPTPTTRPNPRRSSRRATVTPREATMRALDMGGLDEVLGYSIRRAQIAVFQDYDELTSDLGISTVQFSVMRLAHCNPGLNQTALANALGADTPRMVLIIDDLERRGLVTRLASTIDRRSRAIFLTAEGRRLHAVLTKRVAVQNRRMVKRLRGDDKDTLLRMLRNLATPL
jgi:DNA-binding MarR family transcriptional regulator